MRPQAGVGKLKHAPPRQANELHWWGKRSNGSRLGSEFRDAPIGAATVRERFAFSRRAR